MYMGVFVVKISTVKKISLRWLDYNLLLTLRGALKNERKKQEYIFKKKGKYRKISFVIYLK